MRTALTAALSILALAWIAPGSIRLLAQPAFRTSVSTILVDVVVRDEQGRPVPGLRPQDFIVEQDGRLQAITLLDYIPGMAEPNEAPPALGERLVPAWQRRGRTLVIVIDDLGIRHGTTWYAKEALQKFIDANVTPDDAVAVVRTTGGMRSAQPFTGDRAALRAAIDAVHYRPTIHEETAIDDFAGRTRKPELMTAVPASPLDTSDEDLSGAAGRERAEMEARLDQLTDRVFRAGLTATLSSTIRALRDLPGRKGIVVVSDGFALSEEPFAGGIRIANRPLRDVLKSVAREALDAQVVLYMVNATRFNAFLPTALNESAEGPAFLAAETGGYFFKNPSDLQLVTERSMDDLRGYYLLGYEADAQTLSDEHLNRARYHDIRVRVRRKGVSVRARKGFYGVPRPPRTDSDGDALMTAALSSLGSATVPLRMTSFYLEPEPKTRVIRSLLFLDGGSLTIRKDDGTGPGSASVDTLALAIDGEGHIVGQERHTYRMNAEPTDATTIGRAFVYRLDVPVDKPGPYYLRTSIRDLATGAVGAANQFVAVPDVSSGRLAVSGLVVGAQDLAQGANRRALEGSHPAVRRFVLPARLAYSLQVFNARPAAATETPLDAAVALYRGRRRVYAGAPAPVQSDRAGVPVTIAGSLTLGAATAPGDYTLRVTITTRGKSNVRAVADADFTLEK